MMLHNNFYRISEILNGENQLSATFTIDAKHSIFEGHFPGQPVVPGVIMIQIIKEMLELNQGIKLFLTASKQVKFLQMVIPEALKILHVDINWTYEEHIYKVNASIKQGDTFILKMNAVFKPVAS